MQQVMIKKTLLASSLAIALAAPAAFATNGLAPTGIGQEHKAMGGAAVGNPVNTMSMATNPAAASFINDGYDVELELFKPNRTVKGKAGVNPGTYEGDEKPVFLVPGAGYKKQYNNKYAVGITMYGNGGMNTEFKNSPKFPTPGGLFPFNGGGAGAPNTGINLEQLFVSPTLGIKLNEKHSLGLSVNLVAQQFKATGLGALVGGSVPYQQNKANFFTDKGVDTATGIGATIGWMGKLTDTTTAGVSYRLKT
ncbi:MAG: hydrocarbon degradation protein, partial [Aquificaceae bacterium]